MWEPNLSKKIARAKDEMRSFASFVLDGNFGGDKEYIQIERAKEISNYSPRHIGRLAREKKIRARQVHTQFSWLVHKDDILPSNDWELIPSSENRKQKTENSENQNENFLTLKEASELSGYNSDHIGRLAREKKIRAKKIYVNPSWHVHRGDILKYSKNKKTRLRTKLHYAFVASFDVSADKNIELQKLIIGENSAPSATYLQGGAKRLYGLIPHPVVRRAKFLHRVITTSKYAAAGALALSIFLFGGIFYSIGLQINTKNIELYPANVELSSSQNSEDWLNAQNILERDLSPDSLIIDFKADNSTSTVEGNIEDYPAADNLYDDNQIVNEGIWAGIKRIFKFTEKDSKTEKEQVRSFDPINNVVGFRGARAQQGSEQSTANSEQSETSTTNIDESEENDPVRADESSEDSISSGAGNEDNTTSAEQSSEATSIHNSEFIIQDSSEVELPNIDGETSEEGTDQESAADNEFPATDSGDSNDIIYPYSKSMILKGFSTQALKEKAGDAYNTGLNLANLDTVLRLNDIRVKISLAALPAPEINSRLVVEWSIDGDIWNQAEGMDLTTYYANSLNGGYFDFPLS
ncbi:MAG: hypothetical protein R3251_04690, partial [Candidatus Spechtbacterales bacterium]|nr:hypothetical protein [Candidatus Spechtbacterales bacterium]